MLKGVDVKVCLGFTVNVLMVALPPRVSPPLAASLPLLLHSARSDCVHLLLFSVVRWGVPVARVRTGLVLSGRQRGGGREIKTRSARKEPMSEGGGAGGSVSGRVS